MGRASIIDAGNEVHIKKGNKAIFDAGEELTIRADSNFITLDSKGIQVVGKKLKLSKSDSLGSGSEFLGQLASLPVGLIKNI